MKNKRSKRQVLIFCCSAFVVVGFFLSWGTRVGRVYETLTRKRAFFGVLRTTPPLETRPATTNAVLQLLKGKEVVNANPSRGEESAVPASYVGHDWFGAQEVWKSVPGLDACQKRTKDPCTNPPLPYTRRPPLIGHVGIGHLERAEKSHQVRLQLLLRNLEEIRSGLTKMLHQIKSPGPVVVMAIDENGFILFQNFLESCRMAKIDIARSLVIFPTSRKLHTQLVEMGLVSFWSDCLGGTLTSSKIHGFPDSPSEDVMWLKTVSVWLVLNCGRDLVCQDADVVWLRNPIPFLKDNTSIFEGFDSDVLFQHSGSSSNIRAPYFACSGFFFLKSNSRVQEFWTSLLFESMTSFWNTQEAPINMLLGKSCRIGLRVNVLCEHVFVSGRIMLQLESGLVGHQNILPVMMHVNWTPDIHKKIQRLKALGLW
eukprot:CAMPEP_0206217340 /NCGR_PEP_ID=MMETSP0047_2-20121206/3224_1 /ASSEMBLY_ACC=CAM_ASM_000192 /TAXON_ID=195065 /ORGANISM="Chroomonas mesostigmatica_cf, Strain CCMP1168" /LENGTH=425 /DNA_ID=CAMNT_0053639791 /DNA_START=118 /DNA_END=1392 /DNA_ORIENTATION=+